MNHSRPYLPASLATCLRSSWRSSVSVNVAHACSSSSFVNYGQDLAGRDLRPGLDVELGDRAVGRRGDGVLHLHGLEHEHDVARLTSSPSATATLTTVPGIGASRLAARHRVGGIGEARHLA